MNVFELFATLGLDTSQYDEGLEGAEEKGSSFGQKLGTVVGTGAKVAGAAIAATGAALVGTTTAFANGISETASYFDTIQKGSQKLGISSEKYQEWQFILEHNGASIESLKAGMRTLANAVETGNDAFEKIGLTQEQIASMSQEELFAATIEGLQNVESTTERTYLASQLLGRGSTELGALLNMTAEETDAMRESVHQLGGVMTDMALNDGARFQDALQDVQVAFGGVKNRLFSEFLPSVSQAMEGLAQVFAGNEEEGLATIEGGVDNFISAMNRVLPKAIQIGGRIISSLISAISTNLPSLLRSGTSVLNELIQGVIIALPSLLESAMIIIESIGQALLDNAELLLNTGLQLLMMLMAGITEALPSAIPAIISVITMIITTLTSPENLDAFIQGALALVMALADGIVLALPNLVSVIPVVIDNLVTALVDNAPMVLETTLYLLGALAVAILNSLGELLKSIFSVVSSNLQNVYNKAFSWGQNLRNWLSNIGTNLKNKVSSFFTSVATFFSNGFNNLKSKATNGLNSIKEKFTSIFENVKTTVKNAIEKIKSFFDFNWSLPDLKMPHFSISGSFSLNPPSIPKISVDWYKKAMNEPYILDDATIFGAANGKLLGGGEAGSEMVVGTNKLMSMMRDAVGVGNNPITINIYGAEGQDVRELAKEVSRELQNLINDKERVYA